MNNPPSIHELHPNYDKDERQAIEFRNDIIAQRFGESIQIDDLSEDDIQKMHYLLMRDLIPDAGKYRGFPIHSVGYSTVYPYPQEIQHCMKLFLEWKDRYLKEDIHPVLKSMDLFVKFCHIHPFTDGNGRLGRQILYNCLLSYNYIPILFKKEAKECKKEYCTAISIYQNDSDPKPFYDFVLRNLRDQS